MATSSAARTPERLTPGDRRWVAWPTAVLRESRPGVQLVFLLRSVAGTGIALSPTARAAEVVVGWWMLTTAIYVFNGVTDLAADRGNGSRRPIATGGLALGDAVIACAVLVAGGLALCAAVGQTDLELGVALLALGWAYSAGPALKISASGAAVVIGAGAGLTYAAGLVCRGHATGRDVVIAMCLAVWVGVCCASKDFSDAPGDRLAGRRTLPVVLGSDRGARLLAAAAVTVAAVFLALTGAVDTPDVTCALVLAVGSLALAFVVIKTASSSQRQTRRRSYRAFMATQYAANIALIITG